MEDSRWLRESGKRRPDGRKQGDRVIAAGEAGGRDFGTV